MKHKLYSMVRRRQFLQRVIIARNADRCNSQTNSVCPSLCLSVCPSRFGVSSRGMKIRSCGFQYQVVKSF